MSEIWERAKKVFQDVAELPLPERAGFLDAACKGEAAVKTEVEALLAAQDDAGEFLGGDALLDAITDDQVTITREHSPDDWKIGRYSVFGKIGEGGMGIVYRAHDPELERDVAIKMLPPTLVGDADRLARFHREAKLLASLNHPNIATIHSLEGADEQRFFTMELLDGDTLEHQLIKGPLGINDALTVCRQIATALEATHSHGVMHRDLKPANVMVLPDGLVKVLDFGLAKQLDVANNKMTATTMIVGTPGYMSPEQCRCEVADHRTDIWALGCVMYRCLSGKPAFPGDTNSERIAATLEREPDLDALPDSAPRAVRILLDGCLAKKAHDRIDSMRSLRLAIDETIAAATCSKQTLVLEERTEAPNNLPASLTDLIGRDQNLNDIKNLLSTNRLVTLTGVGGCGKTRLAIEAGLSLLSEFADGVWLVELAPIRDPSLVAQSIADSLDVKPTPEKSPTDSLIENVRSKRALLILDNCEHVLAEVARLTEKVLNVSPDLQVLATSREPLGLTGEATYPTGTLAVPHDEDVVSVESVRGCESIHLFTDRARAVNPSFELIEANVSAVAEICRRLDGIPLALELAAARTKALSVEEIANRLDERFKILGGGAKTALPRHQTLGGLMDWSYDQLDEQEQAVLRRLSVFVDGWTLELAEIVCAWDVVKDWEVFDVFMRLVEKSLVEAEATAGKTRYRMLETVREYALLRLEESGDLERAGDRHRDCFLALAEDAFREVQSNKPHAPWVVRLAEERGNLRAALERCIADDSAEAALQMAGAMGWFWTRTGAWSEGRRAYELALAGLSAPPTEGALRSLISAGILAVKQRDYADALARFEEGLTLARQMSDWRRVGGFLHWIGETTRQLGDVDRAYEYFEESLVAYQRVGDPELEASALRTLAFRSGRRAEAQAYQERRLAIYEATGDQKGVASVNRSLSWHASVRGDYVRSRELGERSLEGYRAIDDASGVATALANLGMLAIAEERYEEAGELLEESRDVAQSLPHDIGVDGALSGLALLHFLRHEYEKARGYWEALLAMSRERGDHTGESNFRSCLGWLALRLKETELATSLLKESTDSLRDETMPELVRESLYDFGFLAVSLGNLARAARLFGAAQGLDRELVDAGGYGLFEPGMQRAFEEDFATIRSTLGADDFEREWAAGQAMSLDEAVCYALNDDDTVEA